MKHATMSAHKNSPRSTYATLLRPELADKTVSKKINHRTGEHSLAGTYGSHYATVTRFTQSYQFVTFCLITSKT